MPRYIVTALGCRYADKTVADGPTGPVDACREADRELGDEGLRYRTVERGDPAAEYEVYLVHGQPPVNLPPDLETECRYLTSVAVQRRVSEPASPGAWI